MKDNSDSPRFEVPSTSRRSVLAGLAALGVVYVMPGLFQVNEAMAEPARKSPHPGKSRRSRRSKPSRRSHHSKSGKHHGRRSRASRVMRQPDPRRPI